LIARRGISTLIGIIVFFVVVISVATSIVQYYNKVSQEIDRKAAYTNENLDILSTAFTANEMKMHVLNKGSTCIEVVRIWIKDSNGYHKYDETTIPSFHEFITSGETKLVSIPYVWDGNEVAVKLISDKGKVYPHAVASRTWWDDEWSYRKRIIIINLDGDELRNYQVLINVTYEASMQAGFEDIRFTHRQGSNENEIPFFIQEKQDGKYAFIWLKIPEIKAHACYNEGNTSYFMYYGNARARGVSNPEETFEFYSDYSENAWACSSGFSPKGDKINIDVTRSGDKRAASRHVISLSGNPVEGRPGFLLYTSFLMNATLSDENATVYFGLFSDDVNGIDATQFMGLIFGVNKTIYPYIRNEACTLNYAFDPFWPSDGVSYQLEIRRHGTNFGLNIWTTDKDRPVYSRDINSIDLEGVCYSLIQICNYNDATSDSRFVGALSGFMCIRRYNSPEPIALLGSEEARV
jgi:hypothetical protein